MALSLKRLYVRPVENGSGFEDGAGPVGDEGGSIESRMNEAVRITTAKAVRKSPEEVESILRAEMRAVRVQPGDTASLANDIVTALDPSS